MAGDFRHEDNRFTRDENDISQWLIIFRCERQPPSVLESRPLEPTASAHDAVPQRVNGHCKGNLVTVQKPTS